MNIGAAIHEIPVQFETDTATSGLRARAGHRRVIDLEPIAPFKAKILETEDAAAPPADDHRGRIIDLRV